VRMANNLNTICGSIREIVSINNGNVITIVQAFSKALQCCVLMPEFKGSVLGSAPNFLSYNEQNSSCQFSNGHLSTSKI
jgi:hypothetical protein